MPFSTFAKTVSKTTREICCVESSCAGLDSDVKHVLKKIESYWQWQQHFWNSAAGTFTCRACMHRTAYRKCIETSRTCGSIQWLFNVFVVVRSNGLAERIAKSAAKAHQQKPQRNESLRKIRGRQDSSYPRESQNAGGRRSEKVAGK